MPDNARLDVAVTTRATCWWIRALYDEQPHKPVINLEGVYGGNCHHQHEPERLMVVRRAGYYTLLNGAAGYTSSAFSVCAWGRPIHFGPIYEQDFHDGSYGCRPKRSPHHAMDVLWRETMRIGGGWILEVDLRKFLGGVTSASVHRGAD